MSIEDIKNVYKNANEDSKEDFFPEPIPLQRILASSDPFPIEALGDTLAPFVRELMDIVQAPDGICAQSVLAAASLAVQGHADATLDGREIPLSEFFLTIGISGERKSAIDNIALRAHRTRQDQLRLEQEKLFLYWETETEAYEQAKKDFFRRHKEYKDKKRVIEVIGQPPSRPLDPIILTEEPTYEGLIKLLMNGQPSIGLFSDEGGRFIGGHGMNNDNLLKTAAGMSGLWDGKPTSRVRAGDPNALLYGKRVSFHLMTQPNIAQIMLSNPILVGQGLISRCLIASPISTVGTRLYKEINITKTSEHQKYFSQIENILNTQLPLKTNRLNELSPRKLPLTAEAKRIYVEFHNQIESEIGPSGRFDKIRGFGNKAPEHAIRLAGILTLFHDIHSENINAETMTHGITLANYYLSEALRLHDSGTLDPDLVLAEKLLSWLRSLKQDSISLVDVYQRGPSAIRNAGLARKTMQILENHNWVFPLETGMINNTFKKETWRIIND